MGIYAALVRSHGYFLFNDIAPPAPPAPRLPSRVGRDAAQDFDLGEGFTTQVLVTLWFFNTVATRRSAAPGPRITDRATDRALRPRRRGARRHRLTAGGPPRPASPFGFSSHSLSPRRGGGERALSVRRRVQAPGGKGGLSSASRARDIVLAFMWRINPGAFLRESGTGTLQ